MYFVGFLINPTDINRAVPPKNWACAVPQLWAALRDAPSHQPHSYTTLRKLQLNTMNFLPSIPVPSVNLSPCVFTLLDFTGSKKLHQLNSNIKVFDSQQPETQKFWKAPALTAEQCQLNCVICHRLYSLPHKAAQRWNFTTDPRNHLNIKLLHYAKKKKQFYCYKLNANQDTP